VHTDVALRFPSSKKFLGIITAMETTTRSYTARSEQVVDVSLESCRFRLNNN